MCSALYMSKFQQLAKIYNRHNIGAGNKVEASTVSKYSRCIVGNQFIKVSSIDFTSLAY
jgi:hypothetical protein